MYENKSIKETLDSFSVTQERGLPPAEVAARRMASIN